MNIANEFNANAADIMVKQNGLFVEAILFQLFIDIRASAVAGKTECVMPRFEHTGQYQAAGNYLRSLGYKIGYHDGTRNQIVVSWHTHEIPTWRESLY